MDTSKRRLGSIEASIMSEKEKIENLETLARRGLKAALLLAQHGYATPLVRLREGSVDAIRRVHKLAVGRARVLYRQGKDPKGDNYLKEWLS